MKEIPLPHISLPTSGSGSEDLNRLVAEGKLKFDPRTGNFTLPVQKTSQLAFSVSVGPGRKPARLALYEDDSILRRRTRC